MKQKNLDYRNDDAYYNDIYHVGEDEYCSNCKEWRTYDEQGKCKKCGKQIRDTNAKEIYVTGLGEMGVSLSEAQHYISHNGSG